MKRRTSCHHRSRAPVAANVRPMNRLCEVLAIALACVAIPVLGAELSPRVPVQFQGRWNDDVKDCGHGEGCLEIRANKIIFYESSGPIMAIVTQGRNELALIAELSGEGETYLTVRHFRLSKDQKELSDVTSHPPFVRRRCP